MSAKPLTERLREAETWFGQRCVNDETLEWETNAPLIAADHIEALEATQAELVGAMGWLRLQMRKEQEAGVSGFEDWIEPIDSVLAKLEAEKPLERPAS